MRIINQVVRCGTEMPSAKPLDRSHIISLKITQYMRLANVQEHPLNLSGD
jgi:hypothetical protein